MKRLFALLMVALIAVSLAACVPTPGDLSDLVDSAIDHAENKIEQNIDKNDTNLDIQIGDNDDDVIAVIFHIFQNGVDGFMAEIVFTFIGEGVGFIDKEDAAQR